MENSGHRPTVVATCLSELCHRDASYPKGQSNSPNTNVLQPVMRHAEESNDSISPFHTPQTIHIYTCILSSMHGCISCSSYQFHNTYFKQLVIPGGKRDVAEVVVVSVSSGLAAQVVEYVNWMDLLSLVLRYHILWYVKCMQNQSPSVWLVFRKSPKATFSQQRIENLFWDLNRIKEGGSYKCPAYEIW